MKYIDAGYALSLVALVTYGISLVFRHQRLRRLATARVDHDDVGAPGPSDG